MLIENQTQSEDQRTIALFHWGTVLEEFLDTIGISLETFCNEFTGSWMFGYIEALRRVGVRTVLICISSRVSEISHYRHAPTGATICLLPAPPIYRAIRRRMLTPYSLTVRQAFGELRGARRLQYPLFAVLREVVLYLSTPLRLVARELRREGCEAILCQEYEYPRFDVCVLLGKLMRLPVFATFQGGDYQMGRLERYLRARTVHACAGLIIATRSEAERVRARYDIALTKLARIFNPIDLELWSAVDRKMARAELGLPLDARVVVWHGRVSMRQKGLDTLLDAWEQVCQERPGQDLRLLLVGTGKDAEKLARRLAIMQPRNVLWRNEFVHDRAAIRRYLSASDVYAFPSRHEGFPVSPLEAMGCGLPIVAADAQGVPDIIEGGEASGGVVVPRDSAAEFAQALGGLLDNESWRRELGKRARRRVEASFSLEAVGKQLRAFLLDGRSANELPPGIR
jgi:glycosyltransferase involved in cell wall biosynthesis